MSLIKKAKEKISSKNYVECVEICQQILLKDSSSYYALVYLAYSQTNLGQPDLAYANYCKAIEINGSEHTAYQGCAKLCVDSAARWSRDSEWLSRIVKAVRGFIDLSVDSLRKGTEKWASWSKVLEMELALIKVYQLFGESTIPLYESLLKRNEFDGCNEWKPYELAKEYIAKREVADTALEKSLFEKKRISYALDKKDLVMEIVRKEMSLNTDLDYWLGKWMEWTSDPIDRERARVKLIKVLSRKLLASPKKKELLEKLNFQCKEWKNKFLVWDETPLEWLIDSMDVSNVQEFDSSLLELMATKGKGQLSQVLRVKDDFQALKELMPFSCVIGWLLVATHAYKSNDHELGVNSSIKLLEIIQSREKQYGLAFSKLKITGTFYLAESYFYLDVKYHANALELYHKLLANDANNLGYLEGECRTLSAMGQLDQALIVAEKILSLNASSHTALSELSWLYLRSNRLEQALDYATRANSMDSSYLCQYRLGRVYWAMNDMPNAFKCFLESAKSCPTFSSSFQYLGSYYEAIGDPTKASRCYKKAVLLDSGNESATEKLCNLMTVKSQWSDVIELINSFHSLNSRCCWSWKRLAFAQAELGKNEESIASYQSALRLDVKDPICWLGLGEGYANTGKYLAALKALNRLKTIESDSHLTRLCLYRIALVHSRLGWFVEAIKGFTELLNGGNLGHLLVPVMRGLGDAYLGQSKEWLEIGCYKRIQDNIVKILNLSLQGLEVDRLGFLLLAGEACLLCPWSFEDDGWKKFESKLKELEFEKTFFVSEKSKSSIYQLGCCIFQHAISIKSSSYSWHALGVLMNRIGNTQVAIKCITTAAQMNPGKASYWNDLGVVWFSKNAMQSQHCFIKAIQVDSKYSIAWCNLGYLYLKHQDTQLAGDAFTQAQTADPENAYSWLGQAIISYHMQQPDASTLIEHAMEISNATNIEIIKMFALSAFFNEQFDEKVYFALKKWTEYEQGNLSVPFDLSGRKCLSLFLERHGYYRQALDVLEDYDDECLIKGRCLFNLNDYDKAMEMFQLKSNPLLESLCLIFQAKELNKALESVIPLSETIRVKRSLAKALCYIQMNVFDFAWKEIESVPPSQAYPMIAYYCYKSEDVEKLPFVVCENLSFYSWLITASSRMGCADKAVSVLNKAILNDPVNPMLWIFMSQLVTWVDELEMAQCHITAGIRCSNTNLGHAYSTFSIINLQQQKNHDAMINAQIAVNLEPLSVASWLSFYFSLVPFVMNKSREPTILLSCIDSISRICNDSDLLDLIDVDFQLILAQTRPTASKKILNKAFKQADSFIKNKATTRLWSLMYVYLGRIMMLLGEQEKAVIATRNAFRLNPKQLFMAQELMFVQPSEDNMMTVKTLTKLLKVKL